MGAALEQLQLRLPHLRRVDVRGASLEVAIARVERPETRVCRVLEGNRVVAHPIPMDDPPRVTAFLDGVQESRNVAWLGVVPLVFGRVGAVVRARVDQRLETWSGAPRTFEAMYAPWSRLPQRDRALVQECGLRTRDVDAGDDVPNDSHPLRCMQDATNAVKQDREAVERDLAAEYCDAGAGTLYVDGGLPNAAAVHASSAVVGVVKSHQTLYVSSEDLPTVFGLAAGERSSAFAIESRHRPPVASWYLRLRDARDRDPFWGLVRIEVPASLFERFGASLADERSGWVAAERAPVALPDGRWDTMAYGIRNCEEFLRAATLR